MSKHTKCKDKCNGTHIHNSTLKVFCKKNANIMTLHPRMLAKGILCLTSLCCVWSILPHKTVNTTRAGILSFLFTVVSSAPRALLGM